MTLSKGATAAFSLFALVAQGCDVKKDLTAAGELVVGKVEQGYQATTKAAGDVKTSARREYFSYKTGLTARAVIAFEEGCDSGRADLKTIPAKDGTTKELVCTESKSPFVSEGRQQEQAQPSQDPLYDEAPARGSRPTRQSLPVPGSELR